MRKFLLILGSAIFLGGCTLPSFLNKKPAGLEISTNTPATVFLNGASVGTTPYTNRTLAAGDYTIKLVPTDTGSNLQPWESKLTLVPSASTVISRSFAAADTDSSGYVLQLQPESSGKTTLSVISDPDTVAVTVDGSPHGFTPLSKLDITPASHQLVADSPGYQQLSLSVNTAKGFDLIVNLKLASQNISLDTALATPSATPSASPTASVKPSATPKPSPSPSKAATSSASTSNVPKPYVLIGETETGWLRVRKDASATSDELGKANTGEKLPYLNETTETGWFKVSFEGSPGYVSGKYVTLVK